MKLRPIGSNTSVEGCDGFNVVDRRGSGDEVGESSGKEKAFQVEGCIDCLVHSLINNAIDGEANFAEIVGLETELLAMKAQEYLAIPGLYHSPFVPFVRLPRKLQVNGVASQHRWPLFCQSRYFHCAPRRSEVCIRKPKVMIDLTSAGKLIKLAAFRSN